MKLGIITHYYNTTNYGGVLQSYALCEFFRNNGVDVEQICYNATPRKRSFLSFVKYLLGRIYYFAKRIIHPKANRKIKNRKKSFNTFRDGIPHSSIIYNYKTIKNASNVYDVFVTGSDQVWNPIAINDAYSLLFTDKIKYSYASSVASNVIPDNKNAYFRKFLLDYVDVSVREEKTIELLSSFRKAKLVLDPVFLLSLDKWKEKTSSRMIKEKYIFCYFLGDDLHSREIVDKFSKAEGLKIVNIPYLLNYYRKCDNNFGDYKLSNVTPNDFLSLILYADFVVTDSFHAICFSYIFKKNFFVFERKTKNSMNSRIDDILGLLNLKDQYINFDTNVLVKKTIDYSTLKNNFEDRMRDSRLFIDSIIKTCKEK